MAIKKLVAAAAAAKTTIALSRPISEGERTWTELALSEPTLGMLIHAEQKAGKGASETEQLVQRYALMADVPVTALRRLKTVDNRAIQKWVASLVAEGEPEIEDDRATFPLSQTITVNGKQVTEITLREPDLEAAIAVEKVTGMNAATAATIAVLSGLTIPEARQLLVRDVAAIEAWLIPFVVDSGSTDSAGETSQSSSSED